MFKFSQHHVTDFPFQDYADLDQPEALESLAKYHGLHNFESWMMPQLLAYFGTWQVEQPRWREVCQRNIGDKWAQGVWRVVTQMPRSSLVAKQNKNPKYGALTPLILAGIRESQGIEYSSWDISEGCALVPQKLLEAMLQPVPQLSPTELLACREQVLVSKAGKKKNPESVWSCGAMRGTPLWGTTSLQKVMLLQVWLAHPALRHPLMVLDPNNWDHQPNFLVPQEFTQVPATQVQSNPNNLPWL